MFSIWYNVYSRGEVMADNLTKDGVIAHLKEKIFQLYLVVVAEY